MPQHRQQSYSAAHHRVSHPLIVVVPKISTLRCEQRIDWVWLALSATMLHAGNGWSDEEMHVCLTFHVSHLGVNTEELSVAALLRAYIERQLWHFLQAERLWPPHCRRDATPPPTTTTTHTSSFSSSSSYPSRRRHRSGPLTVSPLSLHKRWCCCSRHLTLLVSLL